MTDYELSESSARRRMRSRYDRPRYSVSWVALILGLTASCFGMIYLSRFLFPVSTETAPWQLSADAKNAYVVAIVLDYTHDGDLANAVQRLVDLRLPVDDPIQAVADIACQLATSPYISTNSGVDAVRAMIQFYKLQNKSGCADDLPLVSNNQPMVVTLILPTPTLLPPPTKTPEPNIFIPENTPAPTRTPFVPPTAPPASFELVVANTFCDTALSGIIEVRVINRNGVELPAQPIRVRWDNGSNTFYTGLKPERGLGYADYQMEQGRAYTIEMPALSNPSTTPLTATPCFTDNNQPAILSYRVVFREG
ncbi:MAG: hypothetical protein MUE54_00165 [Anaerolineae bacterium]|jgi:hypothetical protein|nr:hypothetical protein [Anaerolineae bacterium]